MEEIPVYIGLDLQPKNKEGFDHHEEISMPDYVMERAAVAFSDAYGTWPVAGYDFHRSGRPPFLAKNQRPSYGGGYTKWYFSAEPAATPVVIGDYSSPGSHEYPFYFAGTDKKLHKVQVSYASGPNTFSASPTYESSSTCSGNPIASPVLGETIYWNGSSYSSDRAIYVVDDDKKLYCFKESDGTIEARWGAQ